MVGGIFGKPSDYQARHSLTPETILADGLRARGFHVDKMGHQQFQPVGDYDIVHVHHLGVGSLKMASSTNRSTFIFTPHDGALMCGYNRSIKRRVALRYVARKSDGLVALSQTEVEFLRKTGGADKSIAVIPNGVPAEVFHPGAAIEGGNTRLKRILYVGQLIPLKGVGILLSAFQELARVWEIELLLVYQNALLEDSYRALAKKLGISERVRFIGFLSATELAELYQEVHVVVLPSFAESLPSVITESLLSGKPVVATSVGGIADQIGPYGRVVRPGSSSDLAMGIDEVLRKLPEFEKTAGQMRAYAESRFSVEKMIGSHIEFYEERLKNRHQEEGELSGLFDRIVRFAIEVRK